jgi:molybdopterin-guanine dinucleotide biosynthesis protein MobB
MPVLAISGHSGSGKTTLIERVVPEILKQRLRVAVIKHDVHTIQIDSPGKDSDRLFNAGADIFLHGETEYLVRQHHGNRVEPADLSACLRDIRHRYDVVLVEGFKRSTLPKVWLLADGEQSPPAGIVGVLDSYARDADRATRLLALIADQGGRQWRQTPVYGGILIGGASRRMGEPKHLLRDGAETWIEKTATVVGAAVEQLVIIGPGQLPQALAGVTRLPDVARCDGPLAGMLAALRWAPDAGWLFVACDMPAISPAAIEWLLSQRAPGRWAVLPRLSVEPQIEPLFAYYDPRMAATLESLAHGQRAGFQSLMSHAASACPRVPDLLAGAWRNINAPDGQDGSR